MKPIFYRRTDRLELKPPPSVHFRVERYSKSVKGGPKQAVLYATGQREDLYEFLNWLRVKVEIYNSIGQRRWWGYLARVEISDGDTLTIADLDWMANKIAVAYTLAALGQGTTGRRMTTDWELDQTSIDNFGRKELLDSRANTTSDQAERARDRLLGQKKYPTALPLPNFSGSTLQAKILCKGWWDTLAWRYAPVPTSLALAFETLGTVEQELGEDHNDDAYNVIALAQSFDTAGAINLQEIEIYAKRIGSPPNDLAVGIFENPDDLTPGSQLASTTIAAAEVGTDYGWIRGTLPSSLALDPASTYFLQASTGGVDTDNYYMLLLDGGQGYGAGVLRQKVGSNWGDGPAADMPFRLYSNELVETTQQIKSLITSFGQFLRQVRIENDSGITSESYRNGDSDAQFEIEAMMEDGTTNNRRLFAKVDPDQNVRIWEQPPSSQVALQLGIDGKFRYPNGGEYPIDECPVGFWVWQNGILPSNVDMSLLLGVQGFLLEEFEYVVDGQPSFTPANVDDPWDLGVRDG